MANQIDPRAHEKEIQRQQAVQNTIDAKVKAHQALTDSDIEFICPVAFKETMTKAEIKNLGLDGDKIINEMMSSDYENTVKVFDNNFGSFVTLLR